MMKSEDYQRVVKFTRDILRTDNCSDTFEDWLDGVISLAKHLKEDEFDKRVDLSRECEEILEDDSLSDEDICHAISKKVFLTS